jgi:hypothetical protein
MIREYIKIINKETNVKIYAKTGPNGGYYLTFKKSSYSPEPILATAK